jgi:glucose-6-phosphate-specific signal transduction histidine kinase
MTQVRVVIFLLLAITILTPAIAVVSAEDAIRIQIQLTQRSQAPRQGQVLEGSQIVRPSPRERDAVSQLLTTKPRPKTLKDADMKYLKDLLDKPAWFGFERRIVHEMWTEVSGKEWHDTEVSQPPKNEKSP